MSKPNILHVHIPMHKGEVGPELIGKDLIRYQNFVDPVKIGVITDVKGTDMYAMITDEDTINELLNDNPASLGMKIVEKEGTDDESN